MPKPSNKKEEESHAKSFAVFPKSQIFDKIPKDFNFFCYFLIVTETTRVLEDFWKINDPKISENVQVNHLVAVVSCKNLKLFRT